MIRERQLVPGKMLENLQKVRVYGRVSGLLLPTDEERWIPCMVVSYIPDVGRRHSKTAARRDGWDVLVYWFDERRERLEKVSIANNDYNLQKWRPAGW